MHGIILLIVGTLELILGISFLVKKRVGEAARWYSLFILSVVVWVLTNAAMALSDSASLLYYFTEMTYAGSMFIAPTFLLFSYTFPAPKKAISTAFTVLLFVPAIINIFIVFLSDLYIKNLEIVNGSVQETFDWMIYVFSALFVIYWIWGIFNLVGSYKKSDGLYRWQLKYLLIGIAISSIVGIAFDILLPLFGINFSGRNWIGAEFSIVWLGFTSYILFKKNI